jgi:hypothetical protein
LNGRQPAGSEGDMAEAEHYVVAHTLVNDWTRGTVIRRDQLRLRKPDDPEKVLGDQLERLLALGAIRPALPHEAGLARAPVGPFGEALTPEAQSLLATKDAEIDRLTLQLAAARDKLSFHEARGTLAPPAPPGEDPSLGPVLAEKDQRIAALRAQIDAAHEQLGAAQGTLAQRDEAAGKAAQEARGGREMPSGAAPPYTPGGGPPQVEQPASPASPPVEGAAPPPEPHGRGRHRRGAGEGE